MGRRKRPTYTAEYKAEAARLTSRRSIKEMPLSRPKQRVHFFVAIPARCGHAVSVTTKNGACRIDDTT